MEALELRLRVAAGEDIHTEFKEWPTNPESAAAELVSLANTDGGQVLLGVSDDRQVTGVGHDTNHVFQWVDNVSRQNCVPPIVVVQETVTTESAVVVVVNVPKGRSRPYRTSQGRFYIRTSSGRRDASNEELRRLFQRSGSLYFDESVVAGSSAADLDTEAVRRVVESEGLADEIRGQDSNVLLTNLRLLEEGEATVAAILLFGRTPERFLPQARVVMSRIDGTLIDGQVLDVKYCEGPLPSAPECIETFFSAHLRVPHQMNSFSDERRPEIPKEALREFSINALAHRDYTISAPIRIFVFDDRVEIRSPGAWPNTVTETAVMLGAAHVLRNPRLYTFFARLGLVTDIGSGIVRSVRAVREASGEAPSIAQEENEIVVRISRQASS